jgi:hypothetical protein
LVFNIGTVVLVALYVMDPGGDDDPTNVSSNQDLPSISPAAPTILPAFLSPVPVTQSPLVAFLKYYYGHDNLLSHSSFWK